MKHQLFLLSLILIFTACKKDYLDLGSKSKLVKETYYFDSKDTDPIGFTAYMYGLNDSLAMITKDNAGTIEFKYDNQGRKQKEIRKANGIISTIFIYTYPEELVSEVVNLNSAGDTVNFTRHFYDQNRNIIRSEQFKYAYSISDGREILIPTIFETYSYHSNGKLQRILRNIYKSYNGKSEHVSTFEIFYDWNGNPSRTVTTNINGIISISEYENNYKNGLLIESFMVDIKVSTYRKFEYDKKDRLLRTYDINNFIRSEYIYKHDLLIEFHTYYPDNYDNIPDKLKITVFTYE